MNGVKIETETKKIKTNRFGSYSHRNRELRKTKRHFLETRNLRKIEKK